MNKKEHPTSDIVLAATLMTQGYELDRIETDDRRGTFIFKDVDDEFLMKFALSKCLVEPVAFNYAIKRLTSAVRRLIK